MITRHCFDENYQLENALSGLIKPTLPLLMVSTIKREGNKHNQASKH